MLVNLIDAAIVARERPRTYMFVTESLLYWSKRSQACSLVHTYLQIKYIKVHAKTEPPRTSGARLGPSLPRYFIHLATE